LILEAQINIDHVKIIIPPMLDKKFFICSKTLHQAFKHIRRYFQSLMLCLIYKMVETVKRVLTVSFFINKKTQEGNSMKSLFKFMVASTLIVGGVLVAGTILTTKKIDEYGDDLQNFLH